MSPCLWLKAKVIFGEIDLNGADNRVMDVVEQAAGQGTKFSFCQNGNYSNQKTFFAFLHYFPFIPRFHAHM